LPKPVTIPAAWELVRTMDFASGWIAIDWGTTNRRAFAVDAGGQVIARHADHRGITSIPAGEFPAEVASLRDMLGDRPLLMAGMVGSNRGWVEAPYVPCPARLDSLVRGAMRLPDHGAAIVPGVSYAAEDRFDVMRGEEVQLLGAAAEGLIPADCLACHPGTHAKWARLSNGGIETFLTIMTGELFALLKGHSILAPQLGARVSADAAFFSGVDRGSRGNALAAELFGVRARMLLDDFGPEQASPFVSGLLIGQDVRSGLVFARSDEPIAVIGDPQLTALYAAAIGRTGRSCVEVDGEAAFLGGIKAIAEKLQ
jgi:2-dehydro-3-deoxygalactonokinase